MFKWFWTIFSLGAPDLGVGIPWALDSGFQSRGLLTPQAEEEETFDAVFRLPLILLSQTFFKNTTDRGRIDK